MSAWAPNVWSQGAPTWRIAAVVAGELVTWIGREEASREDRRYRLAFRIDAGRIGLVRFEQLEDAK